MPSYKDRAELIKQLANQAYFDALKKKDEAQKKDVRVGGVNGLTGRYQVLSADGGLTNNGVPTSNAAPPSDGFVRGLQSANVNAVSLGWRKYQDEEFVRVDEAIAVFPLAYRYISSDGGLSPFKLFGFKSDPIPVLPLDNFNQTIYYLDKNEDVPSYLSFKRIVTGFRWLKIRSLDNADFPVFKESSGTTFNYPCSVEDSVFTAVGNDFINNTKVQFEGNLPSPLMPDQDYYVRKEIFNFRISVSPTNEPDRFLSVSDGSGFTIKEVGFSESRNLSIRLSKIVDEEEVSFVEIPNIVLGSQSTGEEYSPDLTTPVPVVRRFGFDKSFDILGFYDSTVVFYVTEILGVSNLTGGNAEIFSNYAKSYLKITIGYANLETQEVVLNSDEVFLRYNGGAIGLVEGDITVPMPAPINSLVNKVVFYSDYGYKARPQDSRPSLQFRIFNKTFGYKLPYYLINFWDGTYTLVNPASNPSQPHFQFGFKYRLYNLDSSEFQELPSTFLEVPVPSATPDSITGSDVANYLQGVANRVFLNASPVTSNALVSSLVTDDLAIRYLFFNTELVFVVVLGVDENSDTLFYISRTIDSDFGEIEELPITKPDDFIDGLVIDNLIIENL